MTGRRTGAMFTPVLWMYRRPPPMTSGMRMLLPPPEVIGPPYWITVRNAPWTPKTLTSLPKGLSS